MKDEIPPELDADEETHKLVLQLQELENVIYQIQNEETAQPQHIPVQHAPLILGPCTVCLEEMTPDTVFMLSNCEHMYHRDCIKGFLKNSVNESRCPITCPEPKCKRELGSQDFMGNLESKEIEKYYQYSFLQALIRQDDISWCPTANCDYAFVYVKGRDNKDFTCTKCHKNYCLDCRADFHKGISCQEYKSIKGGEKEDEAFREFAKGSKLKQCPFCKFWVEKSQGCDHMRCRCGKEFCYKCGGVYQRCACMGFSVPEPGALGEHEAPMPVRRRNGGREQCNIF
ncbi:hypothetical protein FGO68_gene4724 [Halteria grandinella]|uniref:RING-type domain-containing protein n=1 Tax=Halteria grandinella TaxID=5974 RepID=A0A8J8P0Q1_HALGN|nr:hypothetical protein FGO68_gene4724 [Halteria grandinella]